MTAARHLILYDGVCGLCNGVVQAILARDARQVFQFASLQSAVARQVLAAFGRDAADLDTFFVIADRGTAAERLLERSTAALFVLRAFGGIWRLAALGRLLPVGLRDWGYDQIARRRYRMFGRHETCMLPAPEVRNRFLDL